MRYPLFIVRRTDMWEDSWTYGDYKQFICNRPNGQTQCARYSGIPILLWWAGLAMMWTCALTIWFIAIDRINYVHWAIFLIIGFAMTIVRAYLSLTHRELMHAVGPMNNGATRVLPSDRT